MTMNDHALVCGNCGFFAALMCHADPPRMLALGEQDRPGVSASDTGCRFHTERTSVCQRCREREALADRIAEQMARPAQTVGVGGISAGSTANPPQT